MNSGKKILISRRVSFLETPETASAAEHGLRKRLTVLLLIQSRSSNFLSSPCGFLSFFSLAVVGLQSSFNYACLDTATELVNF